MRGRGDVGQFIVEQAVLRCGVAAPTNALPMIAGRWRYSEDDQGVEVRMASEHYPEVEALLRQAFGKPRFGPAETKDGGMLGGYRLTPKGGGIQFGCGAEGTQVIVIRPLSQEEFLNGIVEAMKDERFWENIEVE